MHLPDQEQEASGGVATEETKRRPKPGAAVEPALAAQPPLTGLSGSPAAVAAETAESGGGPGRRLRAAAAGEKRTADASDDELASTRPPPKKTRNRTRAGAGDNVDKQPGAREATSKGSDVPPSATADPSAESADEADEGAVNSQEEDTAINPDALKKRRGRRSRGDETGEKAPVGKGGGGATTGAAKAAVRASEDDCVPLTKARGEGKTSSASASVEDGEEPAPNRRARGKASAAVPPVDEAKGRGRGKAAVVGPAVDAVGGAADPVEEDAPLAQRKRSGRPPGLKAVQKASEAAAKISEPMPEAEISEPMPEADGDADLLSDVGSAGPNGAPRRDADEEGAATAREVVDNDQLDIGTSSQPLERIEELKRVNSNLEAVIRGLREANAALVADRATLLAVTGSTANEKFAVYQRSTEERIKLIEEELARAMAEKERLNEARSDLTSAAAAPAAAATNTGKTSDSALRKRAEAAESRAAELEGSIEELLEHAETAESRIAELKTLVEELQGQIDDGTAVAGADVERRARRAERKLAAALDRIAAADARAEEAKVRADEAEARATEFETRAADAETDAAAVLARVEERDAMLTASEKRARKAERKAEAAGRAAEEAVRRAEEAEAAAARSGGGGTERLKEMEEQLEAAMAEGKGEAKNAGTDNRTLVHPSLLPPLSPYTSHTCTLTTVETLTADLTACRAQATNLHAQVTSQSTQMALLRTSDRYIGTVERMVRLYEELTGVTIEGIEELAAEDGDLESDAGEGGGKEDVAGGAGDSRKEKDARVQYKCVHRGRNG
ncbi:hypothetical protein BDK51DRAFT_47686, partial [Blyttiomyces helicus]